MCECVHVCMCECVHVCMCECVHVCMCECVISINLLYVYKQPSPLPLVQAPSRPLSHSLSLLQLSLTPRPAEPSLTPLPLEETSAAPAYRQYRHIIIHTAILPYTHTPIPRTQEYSNHYCLTGLQKNSAREEETNMYTMQLSVQRNVLGSQLRLLLWTSERCIAS